MRLGQILTFAIMAGNSALGLPLPGDPAINCYSGGYWMGPKEPETKIRKACESMSGWYKPDQRRRECTGGGQWGHVDFEIKHSGDDLGELSTDFCVDTFTKILERCDFGGVHQEHGSDWWLR